MAKGKSFSTTYPLGVRAVSYGVARAPRSLRKRGHAHMSSCTKIELRDIAGLDIVDEKPGSERTLTARMGDAR